MNRGEGLVPVRQPNLVYSLNTSRGGDDNPFGNLPPYSRDPQKTLVMASTNRLTGIWCEKNGH